MPTSTSKSFSSGRDGLTRGVGDRHAPMKAPLQRCIIALRHIAVRTLAIGRG